MKFVDEAKIYIKAGNGGRGCVSFRREKHVPRGGPDGGNGGKGGNVILRASSNRHTLLDLKFNQHWKAQNGGPGGGNNRTGKNGTDVEISVPMGTVIRDAESGTLLGDLVGEGQVCIAAKGGMGGRGNAHFKTATRRTPRFAQDGIAGDERTITLELKLLADVGIIGFPNAGKSTLISSISAARPKIADYPFTTLTPNLGVVQYGDYDSFVIADIPGLIEGAHRGTGLGTQFLRHVERTSVLLHVIDISREECRGAWQDYEAINKELALFNDSMLEKPQVVVFSKMDLPAVRREADRESLPFRKHSIPVCLVSAVTGAGLTELIRETVSRLSEEKNR
ncbi:MAG: GTPase ObgE [Syntrophales bacterium]|jgi:GTP-binding protein|nr:GTPase ObgE [Syntrophales bacterium]MCK9527104.1 GTPase ObgE [Syntrophales bacterium]MDX9921771.1 GTPase ObgE [Syntrophales bacterium]